MPGKDICREVSIVGGTYWETCYWPEWNELYGSGWRSVRVFRAFSPDASVSFNTVGDEFMWKCFAVLQLSDIQIEANMPRS